MKKYWNRFKRKLMKHLVKKSGIYDFGTACIYFSYMLQEILDGMSDHIVMSKKEQTKLQRLVTRLKNFSDYESDICMKYTNKKSIKKVHKDYSDNKKQLFLDLSRNIEKFWW